VLFFLAAMRSLLLCALLLVALVCLLPSSSFPSSVLVAAAPASNKRAAAAASYARENRDLEEDDDDDSGVADEDEDEEDSVPAARRAAAATSAASQRESVDNSGDAEAGPMLLHLTLEHAIDAADAFTPRGEVTLNFNPSRGAGAAAGKALTFSAPQRGSKRTLSAALAANPSALYRLRFVQRGQDPRDALMASVPVVSLPREMLDVGA
jgi:hypothetical protein